MDQQSEDTISRIIDLYGQREIFLLDCPDNFTQRQEVRIEFNDKIDTEIATLPPEKQEEIRALYSLE